MLRLVAMLGAAVVAASGYQLASPSGAVHAPHGRPAADSVVPRQPARSTASPSLVLARAGIRAAAASSRAGQRGATDGIAGKTVQASRHSLVLPKVLPNRVVRVAILMYHHVSAAPAATQLNYGLTVTDAAFEAQLGYLSMHGYHAVLLDQVFAALYKSKPLPSHPIVLTFDDGYSDNFTDALPILRRHRMKAEFNIISAYVGITLGVNNYMTWPQLKALVASGMQIGSHTVDHPDLGMLTERKLRFELRDSRAVLQHKLGVPVQFLAYPAGQPFARGNTAQEQEVLRLMPQYGYVGALCDGPLSTTIQDARTPFELWRIRVAGGEGLGDFGASLAG